MDPSLLAAVVAELDSPEPKLILADWLKENGNPVLAYAYRWAANRKLRPYRSPQGKSVWWGRHPKRLKHPTNSAPWANCLPSLLFDALPRAKGKFSVGRYVCRGVPLAFEALAAALELLKRTAAL